MSELTKSERLTAMAQRILRLHDQIHKLNLKYPPTMMPLHHSMQVRSLQAQLAEEGLCLAQTFLGDDNEE